MKRSQINQTYREAKDCFQRYSWALPPNAKWDITDFGLDDFDNFGLLLINLAEEEEYCEKLMWARKNQVTVCHTHAKKKEDIICRHGELTLQLWDKKPEDGVTPSGSFEVQVDGVNRTHQNGAILKLAAGSRVTLTPGIWHLFYPSSDDCIIGEVSTANDDENDNFFLDPNIGRFPGIEEDEVSEIKLLSE